MNYRNLLLICLTLTTLQVVKAQSKIEQFNHHNLEGWYAYEPETGKHEQASDIFKTSQRMIRLYGEKLGYLMSKQSYSNFKLTVEFRWNTDSTFSRKTDKKNSGIMYLIPSQAPDMLWPKGIQFQIKEGATGDFVLLQDVTILIKGKQTIPGKSVTATRFEDAERPYGQWNTVVITSKDGKIKQELNGKLVNEGTEPTVSEGRILIQYEGYPIDFRKLVMKKLK